MRGSRKGFTLVELIVVVVVIGVLAGIAIARFVSAKEAAYVASMKSDLRNFVLYEQFYAEDNSGAYFSGDGVAQGFKPTVDVTINAVASAGTPPSWQATASHSKTSKTCSVDAAAASSLLVTCP
ncbi:MAG: prepilin-type N-terminal cleavage/methylation domain-containing protein [Gemmatimonadaceae bacterium]